jgi:hypothetical protein
MASNSDISTRITSGSNLSIRRAPTRSRACLIQYSGETLGRRYLLDAPEISMGRSSVNGIVIHDHIYRMATIDAGTQLYNKK